jgi:NDP-sugar pyrophosphorylase family protein
MGVILQFRQITEPGARVIESEAHVLGEVVIFPGVRIERHALEEAPSTTGPARKRAQRARKKQR